MCVCVIYDLIKVADDVVKEAETLNMLMKDLLFLVEVGESGQRGKQHAHSLIRL